MYENYQMPRTCVCIGLCGYVILLLYACTSDTEKVLRRVNVPTDTLEICTYVWSHSYIVDAYFHRHLAT